MDPPVKPGDDKVRYDMNSFPRKRQLGNEIGLKQSGSKSIGGGERHFVVINAIVVTGVFF